MKVDLESIGLFAPEAPSVDVEQEWNTALAEYQEVCAAGEVMFETLETIERGIAAVGLGMDDSLLCYVGNTFDGITSGFQDKDAELAASDLTAALEGAGAKVAEFFKKLWERIKGMFAKVIGLFKKNKDTVKAELARLEKGKNLEVKDKDALITFSEKTADGLKKTVESGVEAAGKVLEAIKGGSPDIAKLKEDAATADVLNPTFSLEKNLYLYGKVKGADLKVADVIKLCKAVLEVDEKGLEKLKKKFEAIKPEKLKLEDKEAAELKSAVSTSARYVGELISVFAKSSGIAKTAANAFQEKEEK